MSDPERLTRNPPSPLARLVLRACAEESPSTAARRRAERAAVEAAGFLAAKSTAAAAAVRLVAPQGAHGLASGAPPAAAGAHVGTTLALGSLAKWFAIGALAGVLAAPAARVIRARGEKHLPATVSSATRAPASPGVTRGKDALTGDVAQPIRPYEPAAPSTPAAQRGRNTEARPIAPETLAAPARGDSALLAAEVEFVDRGRAALQRGAFERVLADLAAYEDRFPRKQLLTEVLFLRMEALSRSGDASRARSLAARVLGREVTGPQAARAREVLRE